MNINFKKFIVFEGLDGSGKTLQAKNLFNYLKTKKEKVILTFEPTKNLLVSKLINDCLIHKKVVSDLTLQLLFSVDRAMHLDKVIIPALKNNFWVISDRYFYSTIAYGALSLNYNWLKKFSEIFLRPGLVFYLDVSPKICFSRIRKRENKEYFEELKKMKKIWLNYKKIISDFKEIKVIEGEREIDLVFLQIKNYFDSYVKKINFKIYQKISKKTVIYPNKGKNFIYPTLGLVGEAGEVAEKIKKIIRDNKGIIKKEVKEEIKKELGDVLWYLTQIATELKLSLEDVAISNLEKLFSRKKRKKT